jgi:hypothetical protein
MTPCRWSSHDAAKSHRTVTRIPDVFIAPFAGSAAAQNGQLYIYPAKGQDQNKQNEDRYDCHSWVVSQTGFDPSKPQANATGGNQQYRPSDRHILRGGARGAALGAVGGAIVGAAGKAPRLALPWADLRTDFGGETKEDNRHLSRRPILSRLNKISKLRTTVRLQHALKAEVTRSSRFTKGVKSPHCRREVNLGSIGPGRLLSRIVTRDRPRLRRRIRI